MRACARARRPKAPLVGSSVEDAKPQWRAKMPLSPISSVRGDPLRAALRRVTAWLLPKRVGACCRVGSRRKQAAELRPPSTRRKVRDCPADNFLVHVFLMLQYFSFAAHFMCSMPTLFGNEVSVVRNASGVVVVDVPCGRGKPLRGLLVWCSLTRASIILAATTATDGLISPSTRPTLPIMSCISSPA